MEGADFSGWVTKYGRKCADGRIINKGAFKHHDGAKVPMVWMHQHNDGTNVLGHVMLEARDEGVYGYAFANETQSGRDALEQVRHGDISQFSIYANKLVERSKVVAHGMIREVSLVLAGANPDAVIENVTLAHGDYEPQADEAVIITGGEDALSHNDQEEEPPVPTDTTLEHADKTVKDVFDSMSEEQKTVVYFLLGEATKAQGGNLAQDDLSQFDEDAILAHMEDDENMARNLFDKLGQQLGATEEPTELTHDQMKAVFADAQKHGSFKEAFVAHAQAYGINNLELLFPDAKTVDGNQPEWIKRQTEWVAGVLSGTRKVPFTRIKSLSSDITHEEARARGYVKGNLKKEEFWGIAKRETGPTTIYKKQKLDRDDIIDVTTMDIVAWMWGEMRLMLDEEIARAILIGDGRDVESEDKIDENKIRPIARDNEFYTRKIVVPANATGDRFVDEVVRARRFYKGTGQPVFYTTEAFLTDLLLTRESGSNKRLYSSEQDLAAALRVSRIVAVEVLEDQEVDDQGLIGVLVNLSDYTVGTDAGGQITRFDDFDIDFNQYKYLLEGRMSGALTKYQSAQVLLRGAGTQIVFQAPSFNESTGVLTLPNTTGVVWRDGQGAVRSPGAQNAIAAGQTVTVKGEAATGYYHSGGTTTEFSFTRPLN